MTLLSKLVQALARYDRYLDDCDSDLVMFLVGMFCVGAVLVGVR